MKYKFNDYFIIHYHKSKFTNIYKRVIEKIYHDRYTVTTYYKVKKVIKCFKSDIIFSEEEVEKLINTYLKEFNVEKTVVYK